MHLEGKKDLALVRRAMNERWNVNKRKVVEALEEVIDQRDPDLLIDAAKLLISASEQDLKLDLKRGAPLTYDGLVEQAKRIPIEDAVRLAAQHGIIIDVGDGRAGESAPVDGEEAGGQAGFTDSATGES